MTTPTRMSVVMDQLVVGARSSRDGVFNTLDAVERKSRAANASLVQQVAKVCAEHPKHPTQAAAAPQPVIETERDTRFDPEDEWEVTLPDAIANGAAASNTSVNNRDSSADDDDNEGFPETWLR